MQLSQLPAQLVEAWGTGDTTKTNPIPVPSQQSITPGAASWTDGFPPLCATPVTSGGIPPAKADMNGALYQMSAVDVWMCAGGGFPYNATFSAAIGGYPKGARVLMASGNGYWVSTVDNNASDPDTGGAGWASADENAMTALTGDVTATGPGSSVATLAASGVTAGSYAPASVTVDAKGRVTAASSSILHKQVFTSSGTFTIPAASSFEWTIVGGGGAGGAGTSGTSGAGGGAGATAYHLATAWTPGDTITITVGTGGAGVSGADGGAGVASSISSGTQSITTVTAGGGGGGGYGGDTLPGVGGSGGTATNGDVDSTQGGDGETATHYSTGSGVSGGSSSFGGGGTGGYANASVVNGSPGTAWGSGGGGGNTTPTNSGGAGAAGIVIVKWVA